ncbi:hypothetical protein OF83DRAFT_1161297 [Amylostereum chailletii]|nr:hypothetical protein OF83DRAFT_1161297 [Amylostereum chailletii]
MSDDLDSPTLEPALLSDQEKDMEKQRAHLKTYLDMLPFEAEAGEEALAKIVSKIAVCVETKNWMVLTTWDGALQCWLLMRYPMSKPVRAKLVRLYYELSLLPGVEPRVLRNWIDMVFRLLASKGGSRRKLEAADLQLPWKPLWRALQKELWVKTRIIDQKRNMAVYYLHLSEQCKRYFPASEIPNMLAEFIPITTSELLTTVVPVMLSFLPPTHIYLYMPTLFKLWEATNSAALDDRLLEFVGFLSEEHVAGSVGIAGPEGGAQWKDVGIWSEKEWTFLAGKILASMSAFDKQGASTTGGYADMKGDRASARVKKTASGALAQIMVYSMAVDGPDRVDRVSSRVETQTSSQTGYLAGSKAMDSLDRLITSTESFFHPSNSGYWSLSLTNFLNCLTNEFCKRWKEEEQPNCRTPSDRRLTKEIRRAFVTTLRTPALLAMFSKEPLSMGFAQATLRSLAVLGPSLIMPELLERAYSGLEVVNETHRTTAVLGMLSSLAQPLTSEKIWIGGQKHIVPLLELCIPGIDLNDPTKTVYTSMLIMSVVQNIKIGDLSSTQSGAPLLGDAPPDDEMDLDIEIHLPDGGVPILSKEEERLLVRESTVSFADWVTSYFRRILALYENLPEEGGRSNTTGGKQEETVLKSLKGTLDVVCPHLSDSLFDLVLRLVYDYATTNAKSNAVKAFGQMISCLSHANPTKVIDKFLPYCISQIKEELKHGASSVRTTSSHAAVPSDTTLHWNLAILRGCVGFDGNAILKHKTAILDILSTLSDKALSERGYSATGRFVMRTLATLVGIYPINSRFVNASDWDSPEFEKDHNLYWGKLYKPEEVKIEWHVPSEDEITFIFEILESLVSPALDKIERLLETAGTWDSVARNDFCRYLHFCRSAWGGLPTFFKEGPKTTIHPGLNLEVEVEELVIATPNVEAGFALTNFEDPRYRKAVKYRERFGSVVHRAAQALSQNHEGEDHIDAVLSVARSIEVYLLDYAMSNDEFAKMQRAYNQAKDLHRIWPKQRETSRLVLVKRAQVYLSSRIYLNSLYRRRDALDDKLIDDLLELSLSPYTRVRRYAQQFIHHVSGSYVRSTKMILPKLFNALSRGVDPDRMKGALYILWNKGIGQCSIHPKDPQLYGQYLMAVLECQHQEKPSIQQLVNNVAKDCVGNLAEEANRSNAYVDDTPELLEALRALEIELPGTSDNTALLEEARSKGKARVKARNLRYDMTSSITPFIPCALTSILQWRYVQMALKFLYELIRRDVAPSPDVCKLFLVNTTSPHPTLRSVAQKGVVKLTVFIKMRTYSKSSQELWLHEWKNPLQRAIPIRSSEEFYSYVKKPISTDVDSQVFFLDKAASGFLTWAPTTKVYLPVPSGNPPFVWEIASQPTLQIIIDMVTHGDYLEKLVALWGQESSKDATKLDLRNDNVIFVKSIAKILQGSGIENILAFLEPLLTDQDRFKQRAAAEVLAGLSRGSKHWPKQHSDTFWQWTISRLDQIYAQIKPDTIAFWETMINVSLQGRDPRRHPELVSWILVLPLDFQSSSAFAMTKSLTMVSCFMDYVGYRDMDLVDKHFRIFLENTNVAYAEMRATIAEDIFMNITNRWNPTYPTVQAFLEACSNTDDPLYIRRSPFVEEVTNFVGQLPVWKEERFPPPRVNQSQYDKVSLTLLRWIWVSFYSPQASLMFPYVIPMLREFLQMTELSDNPELGSHSQAVLYIISAVTPPPELIDPIISTFVDAIKSSTVSDSWRIRQYAMPPLIVFFYRNLLSIPDGAMTRIMDLLLDCLSDDNVEVREMAAKTLSSIVRVSQRQSIIPLRDRFMKLARNTKLPPRRDPGYTESMRTLHSAILGLCALIESFPYSVEEWMPSLTDVLALHATDPPPISTTIRHAASEFKKDTWHKDQMAFDEDQLQNLSTMLVGTSYCFRAVSDGERDGGSERDQVLGIGRVTESHVSLG